MIIRSKYEIDQRVWIVYENRGEACVYDDYIAEICVNNDGLYYMLKEACIEHKEEDIILYEDEETLVAKIKQIMRDIEAKKEDE